ncbi:transient receptor potential cation channel subfamily V member 2 isoform X2 [Thamnophis elegans]|uniref:transient receptor potential cation channel subfamily V member 2 isoform X2 n=1 Tax=Thamnophis elegans TaxID=35005 RepID=UPI001378AD37|nr:transient receptor potential cation channel subfamily V member 2 isoform X2 [Thamnophis elegans]
MSKSRFALETDDGPVEDLNAATKGTAGAEHGLPPLETPFQKEAPPSPQIRVNLNYRPGLVPPDDPNRFDRDRIFQAVVAGDPERLNGLSDYLQRTSSFLTDTKFRDGKTGKTCLMKALLHLKDGHNPTIPLLLEIDKETDNPKSLVNTACTDSYYKGHTALHIAIEKRNLDLVKILVQNEADVHIKASGHFFQPHRKGTFYFGELPLSLAACTNQPEVVMYLLDNEYQKARLTEQDSMGNTVLHALVMVANDTEKNTELVVNMYDMILMKGAEIDPSCKLEEIVNKKQLTPLKLAAKTGKVEILKHMLHREMKDPKFQHLSRKFTEWTYGPIHISLYDLTSIDSFEENSMLEILAYSSNTPNRYKMVALEPVNQLLQYKWESFSRKRFFFSLFLHLIFMLIYTGTAYYRPLNGEPLVPTTVTFPKLLRLIGAVVILIGGIYLFIAQVRAGPRHPGRLRDVLCEHGNICAAHGVRLAFGLGEHALLHPWPPADGDLYRDDSEGHLEGPPALPDGLCDLPVWLCNGSHRSHRGRFPLRPQRVCPAQRRLQRPGRLFGAISDGSAALQVHHRHGRPGVQRECEVQRLCDAVGPPVCHLDLHPLAQHADCPDE